MKLFSLLLTLSFTSAAQTLPYPANYQHPNQGNSRKQLSSRLILATYTQAKVCADASGEDVCRIEITCKEADPLSIFSEVEIEARPIGLTLFKYINDDTGKRNIMLISNVDKTIQGTHVEYVSRNSYAPASLKYDSASMQGSFEQEVNGHVFTTFLICTIPN